MAGLNFTTRADHIIPRFFEDKYGIQSTERSEPLYVQGQKAASGTTLQSTQTRRMGFNSSPTI
jgi:hypothetical protein